MTETEKEMTAEELAAIQDAEDQAVADSADEEEKAPEAYHVRNQSGAVHVIPASHLEGFLARNRKNRLATKAEINRYKKNYSMVGGKVARAKKPKR